MEHQCTNVLWVYTDTLFCPGYIMFDDKNQLVKVLYQKQVLSSHDFKKITKHHFIPDSPNNNELQTNKINEKF